MKSGLTIVEMAQQIERQSKLKQDYLLDTRRLQVEPFGSQLYLHTFDDHDDPLVEPLEINQIAHRQIGTHLKIPAAYYDRMLSDYPELLAENVNSWFQREPTQRMVRTLDGTVRAFLSNRYRRIDNLDIAEIVLPVIQQKMLNCFHYINRKAREYLEQEMKDNDEKPMGGGFGGDVPDELCYQWAREYFRDAEAKEDAEPEEKFVPKTYNGKMPKAGKVKKDKPKKAAPKPAPKPANEEQLTFGDFGTEEAAG